MDKDDFASLQRALDQAAGFMAGDRIGHLVHEPVDVKAIRARTHMSQAQFAQTYRLPLGTVKDWEQARRQPDAPARALLAIIDRDPVQARELLSGTNAG